MANYVNMKLLLKYIILLYLVFINQFYYRSKYIQYSLIIYYLIFSLGFIYSLNLFLICQWIFKYLIKFTML